jgi:hypothetical protein
MYMYQYVYAVSRYICRHTTVHVHRTLCSGEAVDSCCWRPSCWLSLLSASVVPADDEPAISRPGKRGGGQSAAGAGDRDRWPGVSSSSVEMVELHSDPTVRLDSGRSITLEEVRLGQ